MEETLCFPSPNWFQSSILAVSTDGWLVYGGPSKSICVLEPKKPDKAKIVVSGNQPYQAYVAPKAHRDRILCVDLSPEFTTNRDFLSGGDDGVVKLWTLEKLKDKYKIKNTHSHEIHYNESESIVGVGYSTKSLAVSVGNLGNIVKWDLNANVCKTYAKLINNFKSTCMACSPHMRLYVAIGTKQGVIFVISLEGNGKIVYKVRGQDDEIINLGWCPQYEILVSKTLGNIVKKSTATQRLEAIRNEVEDIDVLEQSGTAKTLPEDSFDETIVEEDDTFDIYKDHEENEFGHKKYQPEDILIKVKEEKSDDGDYLAECLKLKEDILKRKMQGEQSIESLVEAMDKTHVSSAENTVESDASSIKCDDDKKLHAEVSVHPHKHLLATISKFGGVRIWSKTGKQVGSCTVPYLNKNNKGKMNGWPTLLWHKPNTLLLVDVKSQLLECNPLLLDSKNSITWRVVHSLHKRGLYAIASDAPRFQTAYDSPESPFYYEAEKWSVYTIAQDRNLIRYNLNSNKVLAIHSTCGGFLYNVICCPYDAGKIAISVGDGAVRVWQSTTLADDDTKLYPGKVHTFWQNVQGKVLSVAWHPTKEHLLAFGTGESRVGLLDTSGKLEKPARTLTPALNGGIYSMSWGEGMQLFVCGGPDLVVYDAGVLTQAPTPVVVVVEGEKWDLAAVKWSARGMLVGSHHGGVALLHPITYQVQAPVFLFRKTIHSIEWHPLQTSNSNDESPYKNLIAVSSQDKCFNIIIVENKEKEGGGHELVVWKTLSGHKMAVLQLDWSPHREELLLSTSHDGTVRVWDIASGTCISIFGNHTQHTLGATWLAMPQFDTKVLSGGADCCLRLWDINEHKAEDYDEFAHETSTKQKKGDKKLKKCNEEVAIVDDESTVHLDASKKPSKKFLLPIIHKQMNPCSFTLLWNMYRKYVDNNATGEEDNILYTDTHAMDFIKLFGSINEINEVLDKEMAKMLEDRSYEAWVMLSIFRGNIDAMMQFASQKDMLTPYLLSMAPCVSFKYWKDATQLYIAQIDRMMARGDEEKLRDNRLYGGGVYRKVAALLSIHDIKGAVAVLNEAKLFVEAYVLCRIRYMDSIAEQTLLEWARYSSFSGNTRLSVICYIALNDLSEAATTLSKRPDRESLCLAADLAKHAGRSTFADQMEKKAETARCSKQNTEKEISELPSRVELIMKISPQTAASTQKDEISEIRDEKDEHMVNKVQTNDGDIHKNGSLQNGDNKADGDTINSDIKVET